MRKNTEVFYIRSNEKGGITLFILLAILFFLIVLFGVFYNLSNKNMTQNAEIENIKKNYDNSMELDEIKEIYDKKVDALKSCQTVTLDNQNATSSGTTLVYQFTGRGIYLDENQTKEMTASQNKIEIPQKNYTITYNFNGGDQEDYSANAVNLIFHDTAQINYLC